MTETQTDVLVVGGGTGGVAAAVAAARAGAGVTLIEQEAMVGGTVTGSYVTYPCGEPRTGLYRQMLERLRGRYALPCGTNWFLPSAWLAVMNDMLEEAGVRVIRGMRARVPLVEEGGGRPRVAGAVLHSGKTNETRIRAAVTIDATGDGAFAEAAGCVTLYGTDAQSDFDEPHAPAARSNEVQHCTWMYISQKIGNRPAFDMTRLAGAGRGISDPALRWYHRDPQACLRQDSGIYLHWGCAVACRDTRDSVALAEAQQAALAVMQPDLDLLRDNGYAVHLAPRLGVRETRRVLGLHVISERDLRSGRMPGDTVAVGAYCLDIWGGSAHGADLLVFGIPYRALVPRDVDGLLLAGKSISGTHLAMSAYRVQPILSVYSQAAGVAAAWCAGRQVQPREADAGAVRAILTSPEQGVSFHYER